ncbi:MAG: hypothetical protein AAFU73_24010 [Planctomycetota bacterium]
MSARSTQAVVPLVAARAATHFRKVLAAAAVVFVAVHPDVVAQEPLLKREIVTFEPHHWSSNFGADIQTDGDWAIVTSWQDRTANPSFDGAGSVRVLKRGPGGWRQHSVLAPPELAFQEHFGKRLGSAHLMGRRIAVAVATGPGSPNYPEVFGRVHIFEFDGADWGLVQTIVPLDVPSGLQYPPIFGHALRFASEDELLIGSPGDRQWLGADPGGSYYVYKRRASGGWRFEYKVTQPPAFATDRRCTLGAPLRIDGDRAVTLFRSLTRHTAHALELSRSPTSGRWELIDVLAIDGITIDSRAEDFDFVGDWIFVADDNRGQGASGRVLTLKRTATGWEQQLDLAPPEPYSVWTPSGLIANEGFGSGLDFDGNRLVVSSMEGFVPGREGRAETFVYDGARWTREHLVVPDDVHVNSRTFGDGVALAGPSILAGFRTYLTEDPAAMPPEYEGGVIFAYDLPRGSLVCSGAPNSTGNGGALAMFGSRSAATGDVYGKADSLPVGTFCLPLVATETDFVAGVGGGSGNLCLGGSIGRMYGQLGPADPAGAFEFDVDTTALPLATGLGAIASGETWYFQVWYRDFTGVQPTQNFTHAMGIAFTD